MSIKKVRRSYDLPEKLVNHFKAWKPIGGLNSKVAGAMLYFMSLDPDTREYCQKLAESQDIAEALKKLRPHSRSALPIQLKEKAPLMPDEDAARILEALFRERPDVLVGVIQRALQGMPKPRKRRDRRKARSPGHKDGRKAAAE